MVSATVKLNTSEWVGYLRKLGPRFHDAAMQGAKLTALRAVSDLQRRTSELDAVDRAFFKRSWRWQILKDGARVFNQAPHASLVEHGRRPGKFPNIGAIRAWAKRRLHVPEKDADRAAFLIGRGIKKHGIKGRNVLGGYLPTLEQHFKEELKRAFNIALGKKP